jgi:uncharacterized protein YegL
MFVLDCSYSMRGSRLESCKKALQDIHRDNIGPGDQFGLITFADDVRVDMDFTTKKGSEERAASMFKNIQVRGMTAMFDGVSKAVAQVQKHAAKPKKSRTATTWIVLLCDGDDSFSRHPRRKNVHSVTAELKRASKAKSVQGLIAIAAGGGISGESKANIKALAEATDAGIFIETSDAGIGEAFGKAAARIETAGLSESL